MCALQRVTQSEIYEEEFENSFGLGEERQNPGWVQPRLWKVHNVCK